MYVLKSLVLYTQQNEEKSLSLFDHTSVTVKLKPSTFFKINGFFLPQDTVKSFKLVWANFLGS